MQGAVKRLPLCMMGAKKPKQFYRGLLSFHVSSDLQ